MCKQLVVMPKLSPLSINLAYVNEDAIAVWQKWLIYILAKCFSALAELSNSVLRNFFFISRIVQIDMS